MVHKERLDRDSCKVKEEDSAKGKEDFEDALECLDILHLFCGEGSPVLVLAEVQASGHLLFTVSEGTAKHWGLVLAGKLGDSVDQLVRVVLAWLYQKPPPSTPSQTQGEGEQCDERKENQTKH